MPSFRSVSYSLSAWEKVQIGSSVLSSLRCLVAAGVTGCGANTPPGRHGPL